MLCFGFSPINLHGVTSERLKSYCKEHFNKLMQQKIRNDTKTHKKRERKHLACIRLNGEDRVQCFYEIYMKFIFTLSKNTLISQILSWFKLPIVPITVGTGHFYYYWYFCQYF